MSKSVQTYSSEFHKLRAMLGLYVRYSLPCFERARKMDERCVTLMKSSSCEYEKHMYHAIHKLCEVYMQNAKQSEGSYVIRGEFLEELIDVYIQASGALDPLVSLKTEYIRPLLEEDLRAMLKVHLELGREKANAYQFFYEKLAVSLKYIFEIQGEFKVGD